MARAETIELSESQAIGFPRLKSLSLACLIAGSAYAGVWGWAKLEVLKKSYISSEIKATFADSDLQLSVDEKHKKRGGELTREDLERALYFYSVENQELQSKINFVRDSIK